MSILFICFSFNVVCVKRKETANTQTLIYPFKYALFCLRHFLKSRHRSHSLNTVMAINLSPQHCTGLIALLPDEIDHLCDLVVDDVKRNVQYDSQQRRARAPTDFNDVTEKFNKKYAGTSVSGSSRRGPIWRSDDLKCAFLMEGVGRRSWLDAILEECRKREALERDKEASVGRHR